jgi:hypothetical protein
MIEILTPILETILDKIIELVSDRMKLSIQLKYFAFGKWNHESPALLALIEVTNSSEQPYTISEFALRISDTVFPNSRIAKEPEYTTQGLFLSLDVLPHNFAEFEKVDLDILTPLYRPYLRINESAIGIVLFNMAASAIQGKDIIIEATIAGQKKKLVGSLLY